MDTSGGFFFSFDTPAEAHDGTNGGDAAQTGGGASPPTWPAPSRSTAAFPWVRPTAELLERWAAAYCAPNPSLTAATRPRQLRLVVPADSPADNSAPSATTVTLTLCYQTSPEVAALTSVAAGSTEFRDVIPGRYYGGLKVWSCATILAEYIGQHADHYRRRFRCANAVVELGCGQGLPGLAAVCLGAKRVVFQDYNAEVLEVCTRPNLAATVAANRLAMTTGCPPSSAASLPVVQFVCGDWTDLRWDGVGEAEGEGRDGESGDASRCEVVLGADVTFDKEACDKLACVLHRWLHPATGEAIIASKDYYFGTNGGYLEFTRSAEALGLVVTLLERVDTADKMPHVIFRVTHGPRSKTR